MILGGENTTNGMTLSIAAMGVRCCVAAVVNQQQKIVLVPRSRIAGIFPESGWFPAAGMILWLQMV
jgi:hypothetical protein